MKSITEVHDRQESIALLNDLLKNGYRYLVRDPESEWLACFSLKPKKYRDLESWGYVNSDESDALMSYVFRNHDITEVNWTNRSAKLITNFLEK